MYFEKLLGKSVRECSRALPHVTVGSTMKHGAGKWM